MVHWQTESSQSLWPSHLTPRNLFDEQGHQFVPWVVWLSVLSAGLWTKGSLVPFPVMAHAWVVDQVPSWGCRRGNHTWMFLSLSFSPLSKNKVFKKILKKKEDQFVKLWALGCCFSKGTPATGPVHWVAPGVWRSLCPGFVPSLAVSGQSPNHSSNHSFYSFPALLR